MKPLHALVAGAAVICLSSTATAQLYESIPATPIPDSPIPGISDTITLVGGPVAISSIRVEINIAHTWGEDLQVYLVPPGSTWSTPFEDPAPAQAIELTTANGGSGTFYDQTSFTGDADAVFVAEGPITGGTPNFTGTYLPEELAEFNTLYSTDSNGNWTLVVYDNVSGDTGTLNSWAIEFGAISPGPDIVVRPAGGTAVPDGGVDPKGSLIIGVTRTFQFGITNSGASNDLNLTGSPPVDIPAGSLVNCAATVVSAPSTPISPGGTSTFTVEITPTASGDFSFDMVIANDDVANDPFDLTVQGVGVEPVVVGRNETFTQDFEPGTQVNYGLTTAGPFPTTSSLGGPLDPAPSAVTDPARIDLYDANLPDGVTVTPNSGSNQVGFDHPPPGPMSIGALDIAFDLSQLDPTIDEVTLSFYWTDSGAEDHPEDILVVSRDGGVTWEAVAFHFLAPRPGIYTQESIDISALVAQLPGANFTDQMLFRFQQADNFTMPDDGTIIDDISLTVVSPDADGDGILDNSDNCPNDANPGQEDLGDGDGVGDVCDNCPSDANPGQEDIGDADGIGDVCDVCPLDATNDADADGVCQDVDNCTNDSNPSQVDSDSDGQGDVCDVCPFDPSNDIDLDTVCGDVDNCPLHANVSQVNTDGDVLGDTCDLCPADGANDIDGDGLCADADNCPLVANPLQENSDSDLFGDACDICPDDSANDSDSDGVCDAMDNCVSNPNPGQGDLDGDGDGDACDACPIDSANDADDDGACANADNCPDDANADQEDSDSDGQGDACDACPGDSANDVDGDGVCGDADNCPQTDNPGQADGDGDGQGDACDSCTGDDTDGDGICDMVDNCPEISNRGQADSDIDGRGDACQKIGGNGCAIGGDGQANPTLPALILGLLLLWRRRESRAQPPRC